MFHYSILNDKTQVLKWQVFIFNFKFLFSLCSSRDGNFCLLKFSTYFSTLFLSDHQCYYIWWSFWLCCLYTGINLLLHISKIWLGGKECSAGKAAGFIHSPVWALAQEFRFDLMGQIMFHEWIPAPVHRA